MSTSGESGDESVNCRIHANFDHRLLRGRRVQRRDRGSQTVTPGSEWAELATAGKDVDKIVSYSTDDAVLIEPGQPVVEGKAAIRAYVAACFSNPAFKIHWKSSKVTFSPDGKIAWGGTDEMTLPSPNGAPITLHLRGISIWRLDSDGQWRCVVDIANEEPVAKTN